MFDMGSIANVAPRSFAAEELQNEQQSLQDGSVFPSPAIEKTWVGKWELLMC